MKMYTKDEVMNLVAVAEESVSKEKVDLIRRLLGVYHIPITDGLGATGGGEEPDNPNTFVRYFETSPILHEAAYDLLASYIYNNTKADDFQSDVSEWAVEVFGRKLATDMGERNRRFLEEAIELVQSTGMSNYEAHSLVDYVYGRETGIPAQEVGGVMVTLGALCEAKGLSLWGCADLELKRIQKPSNKDKIKKKQAEKPTFNEPA